MSPRSVRGRDGEYKLSPEVFRPVAEDGAAIPGLGSKATSATGG